MLSWGKSMSCNGCRVLRKACSEDCMLRECLQWIDAAQAQANATVFVAKFFGRAALMSFISAVPRDQRPFVFQSLLFEAVGRAINPVSGAVGLLWTGNWHLCQAAVATALHGGTIQPLEDGVATGIDVSDPGGRRHSARATLKRTSSSKGHSGVVDEFGPPDDLELCLKHPSAVDEKRREATPSSEDSGTTTLGTRETSPGHHAWKSTGLRGGESKMMTLFV